ncbi:MAG: hypothetical protein RLZZ517_385 [Candidatus Parcubacteria bacterium]|jgi:hypothetical protein
MSKNIKIKVEPIKINVTPYGFYVFARDYYQSANTVSAINFKNKIKYPAYFLYCRSIELTIKSVLLASGEYKLNQIKKHDFSKLIPFLNSKLKKILMLNKKDIDLLLNIDKWYKTDQKKFEYFSLGVAIGFEKLPELPSLVDLKSLNSKMLGPQVDKFVVNS